MWEPRTAFSLRRGGAGSGGGRPAGASAYHVIFPVLPVVAPAHTIDQPCRRLPPGGSFSRTSALTQFQQVRFDCRAGHSPGPQGG